MPRRITAPDREIADSDDDFELWEDNSGEASDDDAYGEVGAETQRLVEVMVSSSEKQASAEKLTPTPPLAHSETSNDNNPQSSTMATAQNQSSSFSEVATVRLSSPPQILPRQTPALVARSSVVSEVATVRLSSPPQRLPPIFAPAAEAAPDSLEDLIGPPSSFQPTQARTQHATQGVESQRIPMDDIRAMGPQTDRSDIFISIHPEHVENIVSGAKNHEFRKYRISNVVTRMWIYTTAPASELRYMARISPAKIPGEISDDRGVGNAEFNANRKEPQFAYELLDVYELNNPVSLSEAKEHGWLNGPPQKYNYVPPGVVGHLMANLRCSVFGNDEDEDEEAAEESPVIVPPPSSGPQFTISQEVTNQLLSEATQHPSDPVIPSDPVYIVPSSQEAERGVIRSQRASTSGFRRPDPPASTPYRRPANPTPSRGVRPSQATTVSQVSSSAESPSKRTTRSQTRSTQEMQLPPTAAADDENSLPPASSSYQLRSSQLLSKSQMLPDSLRSQDMSVIGDDVDIIYDSEADMDEL
jgi:predicted transcriptional regulator